jgi:hypothetical protein
VSEFGRTTNNRSSSFGIAQCSPDHDMDFMNGFDVEAAFAVAPAILEQGGVETIEMLGSEMTKVHTAQMWEYVELDEPAVAVPSAGSKRQLLGRQHFIVR